MKITLKDNEVSIEGMSVDILFFLARQVEAWATSHHVLREAGLTPASEIESENVAISWAEDGFYSHVREFATAEALRLKDVPCGCPHCQLEKDFKHLSPSDIIGHSDE